jgi:hypothetical protein
VSTTAPNCGEATLSLSAKGRSVHANRMAANGAQRCRLPEHPMGMKQAEPKSPAISLEVLGNLIYLARQTDADSAKRHEYLDRAARVVAELGTPPNSASPVESQEPEPVSAPRSANLTGPESDHLSH